MHGHSDTVEYTAVPHSDYPGTADVAAEERKHLDDEPLLADFQPETAMVGMIHMPAVVLNVVDTHHRSHPHAVGALGNNIEEVDAHLKAVQDICGVAVDEFVVDVDMDACVAAAAAADGAGLDTRADREHFSRLY